MKVNMLSGLEERIIGPYIIDERSKGMDTEESKPKENIFHVKKEYLFEGEVKDLSFYNGDKSG